MLLVLLPCPCRWITEMGTIFRGGGWMREMAEGPPDMAAMANALVSRFWWGTETPGGGQPSVHDLIHLPRGFGVTMVGWLGRP